MPELPEVQTVINGLQTLIGDTIIDFWSDWERALHAHGSKVSAENLAQQLKNKKIISIERFGKNIFLHLSDNLTLFIHLRMTGQLLIKKQKTKVKDKAVTIEAFSKYDKHIHHIFYLKKNGTLAFSDIRKFATVKLILTSEAEELKEKSGIDPFDKTFTFANFSKLIAKKQNKTIKDFLMDQAIISGIGNIYASEIPFDAKVDPARKISSLNEIEQKNLYLSIKKILQKAIKFRGTSFSDYRDSAGQKGAFQNMLMVYKKDKQKCKICGTIIKKIVIGQRSTFYCEKCQR